jgi:hypothetical protein
MVFGEGASRGVLRSLELSTERRFARWPRLRRATMATARGADPDPAGVIHALSTGPRQSVAGLP